MVSQWKRCRQAQPSAFMESDMVSVWYCLWSEPERYWRGVDAHHRTHLCFFSVITFCNVPWSINPKYNLGPGHGVQSLS